MKKTILYSLLALTISTSVLTSCEDAFGSFLDKQPSNELTEEQVFGDCSPTGRSGGCGIDCEAAEDVVSAARRALLSDGSDTALGGVPE